MKHLIVVTHPHRLGSASMPRFAEMICREMTARGYEVELFRSKDVLSGLKGVGGALRKYAGYVDDYLLAPPKLKKRIATLKKEGKRPLIVVGDHALGMIARHIADEPHVVHCHDFLAQRSACGDFPENVTKGSGKIYQSLIRSGFRRLRNFISISEATQQDLHRFLAKEPELSAVVYNGLNFDYHPIGADEARKTLKPHFISEEIPPFFFHVGGNQWYKNRFGVIEIYRSYLEQMRAGILASQTQEAPALVMVGPEPKQALREAAGDVPELGGRVIFLSNLTNEQLRAAYNLAKVFVFPSLEEGFGWPPLEALACGTPVLMTEKAPMTEVGGDAVDYIPRMPSSADAQAKQRWAETAATQLDLITLKNSEPERQNRLAQAGRFNADKIIDRYESIYREVFERETQ
ncbi:MAG: glycosyltransferase [Verrucomicrobiota bacterium JB023]|nr:glycosyltransferase [Verrucomicrobiota bacterium JB023]